MNQQQRDFVDRLRGYCEELPTVGITRRRKIARELWKDALAYPEFRGMLRALAYRVVDYPYPHTGHRTQVPADNLILRLHTITENAEQLWKEAPMPRLGWPVEGGPDEHPITRDAAAHIRDGERAALDFGDHRITGAYTRACFAGVVRVAAYDGSQYGAGWLVEIEGDVDGQHLIAGYCHHGTNEYGGLLVAAGDAVEVGQMLGPVGYSGWCIPAGPAGTHLHLKLLVDGVRVDPEPWFS